MSKVIISNKDQIVMSLVHYFVTKENYSPIVVQGAKDEIWLENLINPYKIIRINAKYIHNTDQYEYDVLKVKHVLKQFRKKTLSLSVNVLNICLDLSERVDVEDSKNITTVVFKDFKGIEENDIFNKVFPSIKDNLLKNADNLDLIVNATNDINEKTERENKLFENVFKEKKVIFTSIIIAICFIMYFVTLYMGEGEITSEVLLSLGANNMPTVKAGEIWRLLSAVFLHGGIIHLISNMYALQILGSQVETFIGRWKFLGIYLVSGIMGSLFSLVINNSAIPAVGASGAIFGLMGALLYFGYHYRLYLNDVLVRQLVPVILLNLFIGFTLPYIDNAAHIGGLIGGYLAAVSFGLQGKSDSSEKTNGIITLLILIAFLSYLVFI